MSVKTRSRIKEIPSSYRPGLAVLASLPTASFQELLGALERAPETSTEKELNAWIAPEAKSISADDLANVISSLTSLYRVLIRTEISTERLAEDVVDAMDSADIAAAGDAVPSPTERLATLLKLKSLNVLETKAQELKSEYEHSFCDCRVFTDLRPVFGSNVKDPPTAMLIVHSLRLGYHDSHENKHREFHVSLDAADLRALRAAIDRAEEKSESLKSQLDSAGLKTVGIN